MIVGEMTQTEIVALLAECTLARLACVIGDRPYIVPIHFVFAEMHIYSFSRRGRKIDAMRSNPNACFEVDSMSDDRIWRTAVINGQFEELDEDPRSRYDRGHAWDLLGQHANWWEPGASELVPSEPNSAPEYISTEFELTLSRGDTP